MCGLGLGGFILGIEISVEVACRGLEKRNADTLAGCTADCRMPVGGFLVSIDPLHTLEHKKILTRSPNNPAKDTSMTRITPILSMQAENAHVLLGKTQCSDKACFHRAWR